MSAYFRRAGILCIVALFLGSDLSAAQVRGPATADELPVREEFRYRWRLTNVLGFLAGFFYPSQGDGTLTFESSESGNLTSQLEITSEKGKEGEYWLYGAEVDPRRGRTLRAWSAYRYGDKEKNKKSAVEEDGVVDVASGIYRLRQNPPTQVETMRIWSDGKVYAVQVIPRGEQLRRVADARVKTMSYSIRGLDGAGENSWKGSLELWLAQDKAATPVAILIRRKGIGVLLELQ